MLVGTWVAAGEFWLLLAPWEALELERGWCIEPSIPSLSAGSVSESCMTSVAKTHFPSTY